MTQAETPNEYSPATCLSLRFAILQHCDSAAHLRVKRTASVRLRQSHSHGKLIVITIRISRLQLTGPVSLSLAHCDSSAVVNNTACDGRNRRFYHGEHGGHGGVATAILFFSLRVLRHGYASLRRIRWNRPVNSSECQPVGRIGPRIRKGKSDSLVRNRNLRAIAARRFGCSGKTITTQIDDVQHGVVSDSGSAPRAAENT